MSKNARPFLLLAALAACCVLLRPHVAANAGVDGSPHDFSATGPWDTSATIANVSPSGACSACHRPHRAQDYPIWPRSLAGYRGALTARDGIPSSEANFLITPALRCYDCHDYHSTLDFESPNLPAISNFDSNHRPQDILFGFLKNATGSMTEYNYGPQSGKTTPGYYETNPPGTSSYGVNTSAPLNETGGHYFQHDPASGTHTGKAPNAGDKIPCRDCHDPHAWNSNWQAFIKPNLGGSTGWSRISGGQPVASTSMANAVPMGAAARNDNRSRELCIACHGVSDGSVGPVRFSDINPSYDNNSLIIRSPATIGEHSSLSSVSCRTCHEHNSIAANCSQCHGFPPSPYPPLRSATPPAAYPSGDSHGRHVGRNDGQAPGSIPPYGWDCKVCHATSALGSRAAANIHQDNSMSIAYDFSSLGVGNPPDRVSTGALTCSNVYCHSNGGSDNTAAVTGGYYTPAQWGDSAAPLRCNRCHGAAKTGLTQTPDNTIQTGMPNYPSGAAGSATANTHNIHVVANRYDCAVCHFDTAQGNYATGRTIKTSPLLHVNGIREVVFDGSTAIGGAVPYTGGTEKRCAVSCHNSRILPLAQQPRWGGTLPNGCFNCHFGTEAIFKPQDNVGLPNPVDNNEYVYSGHGRTGTNYPGSGNVPAGFGNYTTAPAACYVCHSQTASHTTKSSNDPFRLGHSTDGTTGGMGTWTGAWADNTDRLCIGCHGTAAERSGHDNAAQGIKTVDVQTHARGLMNNPVYSWPVTPWKCVDCHDPHGDGRSGAERYMMIRSGINAPINGADGNAGSDIKSRPKRTDSNVRAVSFTSMSGYAAGSYTQPGNGTGGTWGPCEVCHTQTTAYSRTLDNTSTHATRTNRCTICHPHKAAFGPTACRGCHGPDSVATAAGAPDMGAYWTTSGHGRFNTGSPSRPIECEDCHDSGYLTSLDHKTDGTVPGSPPNNINTEYWPGKSPMNVDTNPNRNTSHLRSVYDNTGATVRSGVARVFDNYCANACHARDYHRHQKNNGAAPRDVMRFGDAETSTTSNPKQYNWYSYSSFPSEFYKSRSPIVDNDLFSRFGTPSDGAFGVCVSCHDPHGTATTDTKGGGAQATNAMVRGNWKTDATGFCSRACHTSRTPP